MNRNHWHDYQFSTSWSLSLQSCKIVEDQERHRPPNASENPGRVLQTSSIPPKRYSIIVLLISKFFWVFLTLLCAKIAGVLHILWNHGRKYLLAQLSPLATSLGSWKPVKMCIYFSLKPAQFSMLASSFLPSCLSSTWLGPLRPGASDGPGMIVLFCLSPLHSIFSGSSKKRGMPVQLILTYPRAQGWRGRVRRRQYLRLGHSDHWLTPIP